MNIIYMNIYKYIFTQLIIHSYLMLAVLKLPAEFRFIPPPPIYFAHVVLDQHTFRVQRNKGDIVPNALAS